MRETLRTRALVPVLVFVVTVAALIASLGVPLIPTIAEEYDVFPHGGAVGPHDHPARRGGDHSRPGVNSA